MTEKQREAIEKHGRNLQAIFPNAEPDPIKLCKRLRRLESQAHAIGLQMCNGPEMTEDEKDQRDNAVYDKLDAILGIETASDDPRRVFINHDPRGYALKISDEWMRNNPNGLHRDWGGYGILAPEIDKDGN